MKANSWFPFWFLSSRPLNVQGQQSKQQNKVLHLFKANNEDFRTTPVAFHVETSYLIYSTNQMTGFYMKSNKRCSGVFIVSFE